MAAEVVEASMSTMELARPAQRQKLPNTSNARAHMSSFRCWGKFWSTYTGKDKTARIIQYSSLFVKWYLQLHNSDSVWAANFEAMSKNVSRGRLTFRLFRWIDE